MECDVKPRVAGRNIQLIMKGSRVAVMKRRTQNTVAGVIRRLSPLFIGFAAFLVLGIAAQLLMRRIALTNRKARSGFVKSYDSVILRIAGSRFSPYAALTHVGRRSGREYRTPLGASPLGDGFVLGLAFGPDADWCRNVLAAGKASLKWHGHEYVLEHPELVPAAVALGAYPGWKRFLLGHIGVQQYLWLHRAYNTPGQLTAESGHAEGAAPSSDTKTHFGTSARWSLSGGAWQRRDRATVR